MLTDIFKDLQIPFTFPAHTQIQPDTHPEIPRHTHTQTHTYYSQALSCAAFENRNRPQKGTVFLLFFSFYSGSQFPKLINKLPRPRVSVYLRNCQTRLGSSKRTDNQSDKRASKKKCQKQNRNRNQKRKKKWQVE